ncbi:hypothetical protein DI392_05830 [Vibrio albus]|uniref:Uncharacterized protein n=1 Tax=Vibrio albus TaxID=2200953 RepID=A0A2U3BCW4_9VIBR|nr:hypothetical protein DI392_05830 [Vibrio albus]
MVIPAKAGILFFKAYSRSHAPAWECIRVILIDDIPVLVITAVIQANRYQPVMYGSVEPGTHSHAEHGNEEMR